MKLNHYVALAGLSLVLSAALAQTRLSQTKDIIERTLAGQATGNDAIRLSFLILNKDGSTQMERAAHFPFYSGEIMRVKVLSGQSGTLQLVNINAAGKATPFRSIAVQGGVPAFYPPEPGAVLEFANTTGNEVIRVNFVPSAMATQSVAPQVMPPATNLPSSPQTVNPPTALQQAIVVAGSNVSSNAGAYPPVSPLSAQRPTRPSEFFSDVQGKAYTYEKDIREVVIETPQATYLTRPSGTGVLTFDVTLQHRNQ